MCTEECTYDDTPMDIDDNKPQAYNNVCEHNIRREMTCTTVCNCMNESCFRNQHHTQTITPTITLIINLQ